MVEIQLSLLSFDFWNETPGAPTSSQLRASVHLL